MQTYKQLFSNNNVFLLSTYYPNKFILSIMSARKICKNLLHFNTISRILSVFLEF